MATWGKGSGRPPVWITTAGSLGKIQEGLFYQLPVKAYDPDAEFIADATQGSNVLTNVTEMYNWPKFTQPGTAITGFAIDEPTLVVSADPEAGTITLDKPLGATATGKTYFNDFDSLYYLMIAGELPPGIQCRLTGLIEGTPKAVGSLQGVALDVDEDVTSTFCVRVYTEYYTGVGDEEAIDTLSDRTFSLTVTGQDQPTFVTPAGQIATTIDGDDFEFQIEISDDDPGDTTEVTLEGGELPDGLTIDSTGLISGYLKPVQSLDRGAEAGYDGELGKDYYPYDFTTRSISKNYEFTLGVSDGKDKILRDFSIFVYSKNAMVGDTESVTGDNAFITGDIIPTRTPLLLTDSSDLGRIRHDNFFAYKFDGIDLDGDAIEYVLSLGSGVGYDSVSFYGVRVDLFCTGTSGSTTLTIQDLVDSSLPDSVTELRAGMEVRVAGVPTGARIVSVTGDEVEIDRALVRDVDRRVSFVYNPGAGVDIEGAFSRDGEVFDKTGLQLPPGLSISSETGWLTGYIPEQSITEVTYRFGIQVRKRDYPNIISPYYFFTMTIIGDIETEVTWLTPEFLGNLTAGTASTFYVEAETRSGLDLLYRLKRGNYPEEGGQYNRLPQGLRLLSNGQIVGTATFNTFSLDRGTTTFDRELETRLEVDETTFDLNFEFTVNAYNTDSITEFRSIQSIDVTNGGEDYLTTPSITFSPDPVGSEAIPATAGTVTISDGSVVNITVSSGGSGYSPTTTGVSIVRSGDEPTTLVDASAVATVSGNVVTGISITAPGANYGNVPSVIITGEGTGAIASATLGNGVITEIDVGNPGAAYTVNPNVTITPFTTTTLATGNISGNTISLVNQDGTPATIPELVVGLDVTGNGIAASSNIANIAGSTITLSANLTANVNGNVTFTDNSGSGATAQATSYVEDTSGGVSVYKTFNIQLLREYTEPYEELYVKALAPADDRATISALLSNTSIFDPERIYRLEDANFGVATDVVYRHAYGVTASALSSYVLAMRLNHYDKQLVLGPLKTARALASDGSVLYEVVYSEVVDDMVNSDGTSVSKSVALNTPVDVDGEDVQTVYPNSLFNMREQVIDTVGTVAPGLPLWMTSKQTDGRILGFTRAWVIAYTQPSASGRIKYDIEQAYPEGFNSIDFEMDRYEIYKAQTHNWIPTIDIPGDTVDNTVRTVDSERISVDLTPRDGEWEESAGMTTFDRNTGSETIFDSGSMRFVAPVDVYGEGDTFDKYMLFPKRTVLQ